AEEVLRIVLRLDEGQPLIIIAVRRANAIFAFSFHHEVYVRAAGAVRMQVLPVAFGPSGYTILVGRIWVHTDDHLAPDGVAIAPGSVFVSRFVRGSIYGIQMHRRVQRG